MTIETHEVNGEEFVIIYCGISDIYRTGEIMEIEGGYFIDCMDRRIDRAVPSAVKEILRSNDLKNPPLFAFELSDRACRGFPILVFPVEEDVNNIKLSNRLLMARKIGYAGDLYLVSDSEQKHFMKIGMSTNPEKRIKRLNKNLPFELKTLYVLEGLGHYEFILHDAFKRLNTRGEWFVYSQQIIEMFEFLKKAHENKK